MYETLEYNGGLKATCGWEYAEADSTELPPSSITEDNRITRATVDKATGRIDLAVETANEAKAEVEITSGVVRAIAEPASGGNPAYIKLSAINNNPSSATISADKIDMSGVVNFLNGSTGPGYATKTGLGQSNYTQINGGNIRTGNIQSVGYTPPAQYDDYSNVGSEIDLEKGNITTPMFYSKWDEDTQTYRAGFKGNLEAASGTFSGNLSATTTDFQKLRVSMGTYQGHTYYGTIYSPRNGIVRFSEDSGITNPASIEIDRGSNVTIKAGEGNVVLDATSGVCLRGIEMFNTNDPSGTGAQGQLYFKYNTTNKTVEMYMYLDSEIVGSGNVGWYKVS